jgi:hypothetical protein
VVQLYASGLTVGVLTGSTAVSVIDLSGSTPTEADITLPVPVGSAGEGAPYVAVSASQWLAANQFGVLLDSGGRNFGFGQAWSIAGGTGHFAIATASGTILCFNSTTLAQEAQIAFAASKVALSSDGSVLVALGASSAYGYGNGAVEAYSLPAGTVLATPAEAGIVLDIALSGSGTVLGQVAFSSGGTTPSYYTQEAGPLTGGSAIFSSTFNAAATESPAPPIRISPEGTLIATSQSISPVQLGTTPLPGTNLLQNGVLVTAFSGLPVGWLDDSRLVVSNYARVGLNSEYTGCTIYGANGSPTGGTCAIPVESMQLQPVTSDLIYVPTTNQVISVSTGSIGWTSGDPDTRPFATGAAVAGSQVIFVSGTNVLAQSF